MTDHAYLEHLLLPPDPADAPGWREWPAPALRRLALCALLDRIDELADTGQGVRVVIPDHAWTSWRGLGARLTASGSPATVVAASSAEGAEQVTMPEDAADARRGRHGAALLGARAVPMRHLGLTVAGEPGSAPAQGPWQVVTDEGWRATLTCADLLDPLLALRPGQRLQAVVAATGEPMIVSAWH